MIPFAAIVIAVTGLLLILSGLNPGVRQLAGRLFVVGVILAAAEGAIGHRQSSPEAVNELR